MWPRLRSIRKIVEVTIGVEEGALLGASDAKLRTISAMRAGEKALREAPEEMKGDRLIVQAAVKHNGTALQYASKEMKGDRAIVQAAVEQYGAALQYASDGMINNTTILLAAFQRSSWGAPCTLPT